MSDAKVPPDWLDVGDMSPAEVLRRLYNGSFTKGLGRLQFAAADMTPEQAQRLVDSYPAGGHPGRRIYFDYLQGRVIKTFVDERPLEVRLYDRDNGEGAAARALGIKVP